MNPNKFFYRINKERTKITGALCGLGFIEGTGQAILPEHDMEVVFDVEFTKDDIQKVKLAFIILNSYLIHMLQMSFIILMVLIYYCFITSLFSIPG